MDNTERSMKGNVGIICPVKKQKRRGKFTPTKWARAEFETQNPPSCAENTITQSQGKWWGGGWQEDPASVFKVRVHSSNYIYRIYIYTVYIFIYIQKRYSPKKRLRYGRPLKMQWCKEK